MSRLTTLFNNQKYHQRIKYRGSQKYYDPLYGSTKYLRKVIYQTLTKGRNPHHIK